MIEDEIYEAANGYGFRAFPGEQYRVRWGRLKHEPGLAFELFRYSRRDWDADEDQATRDWLKQQWSRIAERDRVQTPAPSSSNGQATTPSKRAAVAYSNAAKDAHVSIAWGLFSLEFDEGGKAIAGDNLKYLRGIGEMILRAVDDYEQQERAEK